MSETEKISKDQFEVYESLYNFHILRIYGYGYKPRYFFV